jgi:hypothetical protein
MSALANRSASTPIYRRRCDKSAAELIAEVMTACVVEPVGDRRIEDQES